MNSQVLCNLIFKSSAFLAAALLPFVASGQTLSGDSIAFGVVNPVQPMTVTDALPDSVSDIVHEDFIVGEKAVSVMMPSRSLSDSDGISLIYDFVPGQSAPFGWNGGGLWGYGYSIDYPGLMRFENASLGVFQQFGDLAFYVGGVADRYGNYWGGVHTRLGVEGSFTYRLAPQLSANVFGVYYFGNPPALTGGMPMSPAMTGFYNRSNFGATFDYQFSEHWGVEAGARMVQPVGTNRFEAEPIATPYYKFNDKVKIGLPVGQILYHIVRSHRK